MRAACLAVLVVVVPLLVPALALLLPVVRLSVQPGLAMPLPELGQRVSHQPRKGAPARGAGPGPAWRRLALVRTACRLVLLVLLVLVLRLLVLLVL
jgi:hypothetical protein